MEAASLLFLGAPSRSRVELPCLHRYSIPPSASRIRGCMYDVALWKAPTFWHRDGTVFLTAEASLTAGTCQKKRRR
jgi:hypothetical protein